MSVKIVVAHHPYEAQREDEISFDKDEVIKVTDFSDPDWWVGKKKDGALGFFPSNFVREENATDENPKVEEKEGESESDVVVVVDGQKEEGEEEEEEEAVAEEPVEDKVICMARVMGDYAMQETGEISLHRGGIINVYQVIDGEWSRGELNGKVGKYPSKFVEDIDMPGRPDLGKQSQSEVQADDEAPKGGFKLAAFGVKQGGIGSLLAGGFPGLKKTGCVKTDAVVEEKPKAETTAAVEEQPTVVEESKPVSQEETPLSLGKAIVLHPYDAESEDELSLLRGEYVDILDRNADDGWWKGLNERGQAGIFPCNFVRELDQESITPPAPTRALRYGQSTTTGASRPPTLTALMARLPPQVLRPASVQTPTAARPISAQRPFSISHITSSATATATAISPPISEEEPTTGDESTKEEEPTTGDESTKEEEPTTGDESIKEKEPTTEDEPTKEEESIKKEEVAPVVEEVHSPPIIERKSQDSSSIKSPSIEEFQPTTLSSNEEGVKSPVVIPEDPISDEEEKESGVEEIPLPPVAAAREMIKPVEQEEVQEPVVIADDGEFKDTTEEEKKEFDIIPTGPKLTTPSRARIGGGRARRTAQVVNSEPSQTEILQKEILEQQEEPVTEEESLPPVKPVKPIFAKFPTPFAVGADAISKTHLKPTQTRRLWDDKPAESAPSVTIEQEPQLVRPSGVKNIASRFNSGGGGASNEVLETKLKNHTKNEVEKVRKEFEQLLNEEREKRLALENVVNELLEKVKALQQE